jgi:tetratricopeptide (TPR) repeat protein
MKVKLPGIQLLLVLLLFCAPSGAQAQTSPSRDMNSLFLKANQDYNNGHYQEAAEAYDIVLRKRENGYLYFNLGNCYLKMNKIGPAILNYRRAQKFIPRFADLEMNLKYARQETRDKIEDKSYRQLLQTIFFWYYRLNTRELLIGLLSLNLIFFLLASIKMYTQSDALKWLLIVAGIVYLLNVGSAAARLYQDKFQQSGVVVGEEIEVRSGSSLNHVVLFKLHAGTEIRIEEVEADWLKIALPDGKIGWTPQKGLGII